MRHRQVQVEPESAIPNSSERGRRSIDLRDDFVEAYGARVFLALSAVGALFLLPFAIHNLLQRHWVVAASAALVALCLLGNAVALVRKKAVPFAPVFIFGPALVALGVAMYQQGLVGILWTYAAILLFHFVLPRRQANLYNAAIILLAIPMAWLHLGAGIAVRVGATLVLTVLFTNIFSWLTDAQRLKEAQHRQRLDLMVRGTNAGTLEWDAGGVMRYSGRLMQMLGLSPDGPAHAGLFLDFIHPDDRPRIAARMHQNFERRGAPSSVEPLPPDDYRIEHASGEAVWVHTEGIAVCDAKGRVQRCILSFMDITEQVRAQATLIDAHERLGQQARQLEAQNAQLQAAIRMREEVERMARHDLRTPLSSIASVPKLMRESGPLAQRHEELLSMVEHASLRVLRMVNLSLDLYRMEEGTYRPRPQAVELYGLAGTVARELRGHAESKRLTIEIDALRGECLARGEELLSYSVVANLLKNAVEAAPEGSAVRMTVSSAQDASLAIHNQGSVPQEVRSAFFEKYTTHGKDGGTGLGAYSARLMARMQGGDLSMETSDEEGTTLTLKLPLWEEPDASSEGDDRSQHRKAVEVAAPAALEAASLLLVDDDAYNLLVLKSLLPTPPLVVREAINGRAALERVAEARPDFIFLDLQMPVMGGPEALSRIRALQRERGEAPSVVVAFSAWDDEATRARCAQAGFDHYLVKPASRDEILSIVQSRRIAQGDGDADDGRVDKEAMALMPEFIESRRELLAQMAEAMRSGDRVCVKATSHMLAGSLGLYGFDTTSEFARRIATHAISGETEWLQARCDELRDRFERDQAIVREGIRC